MKLETSIPMRADGTVIVHGLDKTDYVFALEEATGMVVCEVGHEETVSHLLRQGGFFPADEADHELAANLLEQDQETGEDDQDEDGDDEQEEADENALPVEAGTPPAPRKKKAAAE